VIKVYWTEISDSEYKKSRIMFLINIPVYKFVIKAMGYLPGNKRRGTPRSKFLRPLMIELEMISGIENFDSFEITEKEFLKWIGRISLDQVLSLEDIGWIMKVKKDYEESV
jgi:hypothetical protein